MSAFPNQQADPAQREETDEQNGENRPAGGMNAAFHHRPFRGLTIGAAEAMLARLDRNGDGWRAQ
jgi:hypothetical protein